MKYFAQSFGAVSETSNSGEIDLSLSDGPFSTSQPLGISILHQNNGKFINMFEINRIVEVVVVEAKFTLQPAL